MMSETDTILKDLFEEYDIPSECSVIAKSVKEDYYIVKYDRSFKDYVHSITDIHINILIKKNLNNVKRLLQNWKYHHILLISVEDLEDVRLFSDPKLKIIDNWMYIEEDDTDYDNIYTDWYPRDKYRESSIYENYFRFEDIEEEEDW